MSIQLDENCVKYSETPELLEEIAKVTSIIIEFLSKKKYFPEDKEERNVYNVTVIRGFLKFSFEFGASLNMTEKDEEPSVYDILCCLKNDGLVQAENFEDFCDEFGYSHDSIKASKLWENVSRQGGRMIRQLFTVGELESFPS